MTSKIDKKYLITLTSLIALMCLNSLLLSVNAFPHGLVRNNANEGYILDTNQNNTINLRYDGYGNYSSGDNINTFSDTKRIINNKVPKFLNYGTTEITVSPEFLYKTEVIAEDIIFQNTHHLSGADILVEFDNTTYDYYSDLELNISSIEYLTSFSDYGDVIGASANVISGNPYPFPKVPTTSAMTSFEDNDYIHSGAWAEARSWDFMEEYAYPSEMEYPQYWGSGSYGVPYVNVSVEICVEIINGQMGSNGELNYQDYWDLLQHQYRMTLEAITDSRIGLVASSPTIDKEIVIADEVGWEASLMFRNGDENYKYLFDTYYENTMTGDGIITVDDILGNPPDRNPDIIGNPIGTFTYNHWEFDNRSINQTDIDSGCGYSITENMFTDYSISKGYVSPNGNPIITFNFTAWGLGWNNIWSGDEYGYWLYGLMSDPEDQYRAGGVDISGVSVPPNLSPPTCWAKIKVCEFDSKHRFKWDTSQNNNIGEFNHQEDVLSGYYNRSSGSNDPSTFIHAKFNKDGFLRIVKDWKNRIPLDICNMTSLTCDNTSAYEFMNVTLDSIKAKCYKSEKNTRSEMIFDSTFMNRIGDNWSIQTNDLSHESYFRDAGNYSEILIDLTEKFWDSGWESYEGYIFKYDIDFIDFYVEGDFNTTNGYGEVNLAFVCTYYKQINVIWTNFTAIGNYLTILKLNSSDQSPDKTFIAYTPQDIPIWKTNLSSNYLFAEGFGIRELHIEWWSDIIIPLYTNYTMHMEINDLNITILEFNVTAEDVNEILDAFVVFEDKVSLDRISFRLNHKSGNTFFKVLDNNDIPLGIYSVWYGLNDLAGNYNGTNKFDFSSISYHPNPFILSSNADSPKDSDGTFTLSWTNSLYAHNYSVYQYNETITQINDSLTLLENETILRIRLISNFVDGDYFFIVIAFNDLGNCSSNCLNVIVEIVSIESDDDDDSDDDNVTKEERNITWITLASIISLMSVALYLIIGGALLKLHEKEDFGMLAFALIGIVIGIAGYTIGIAVSTIIFP